MLPAHVKKEFRGENISFLYGIHPIAISQVSTRFSSILQRKDM